MNDIGKRIVVMGSPGAGKTTFSDKLGKILSLPVYHLDKYFWKNWKECPDEEWNKIVTKFTQEDSWIIDGNYMRTIDIRLERAETAVFLDYKRRVCLWSVFKRVVKNYGKQRPDLGDGCPERFDMKFMKWVYDFPEKYRPELFGKLQEYPQVSKIILLSRKEADKFLSDIAEKVNE